MLTKLLFLKSAFAVGMGNKLERAQQTLSLIHIWLWESDSFVDENTLSVNVGRLRRKLEAAGLPDLIRTRKGEGYLVEE